MGNGAMPFLLGICKPYYNQVCALASQGPLSISSSSGLVDFIVEWTDLSTPASPESDEYWTMYFDGSLTIDGAGAGVLFVSPSKEQLQYVLRIYFPASNNAVEYEACLHGLRIAVELGVKRLYIYGDSALVINQLNRTGIQPAKRWMHTANR